VVLSLIFETLGATTVFTVCFCGLYMRKGQKHCILDYFTMFLLPERKKNRQTMAQNLSKINFQKHRVILASFFPPLDPQKRENKNSVKDFGGRQQERAPG